MPMERFWNTAERSDCGVIMLVRRLHKLSCLTLALLVTSARRLLASARFEKGTPKAD